ncbi:MAG: hypothetical protein AB7Q92_21565 [Acidimicrobiia bacterium]
MDRDELRQLLVGDGIGRASEVAVAAAVVALDAAGQRALCTALAAALTDPDASLRAAAVRALALPVHHPPATWLLGAAAAAAPHLTEPERGELLVRAAAWLTADELDAPHVRSGMEAALADPARRTPVLEALATSVPDEVVANAPRWCRTGDVGVLARLQYWHRVTLAVTLAPWPAGTAERVEAELVRLGADADLGSVRAVLDGTEPGVRAPHPDPDPGRRWRAVRDNPWVWTLWEGDDGTLVLEVVMDGIGVWSRTHVLTDDERGRLDPSVSRPLRLAGLDALAADVVQARVPCLPPPEPPRPARPARTSKRRRPPA